MSEVKPKSQRRFLIVLSIVFAVFAAALLVGKLIEDHRGTQAWRNYRDAASARGESLEWKNYIPDPIADEDNFALRPIVADGGRLADIDLRELPSFGLSGRIADWTVAQEVALSGYFQDPTAPLEEEAAMATLGKAFARWKEPLDELEEAVQLPDSRFPLSYDQSTAMEVEGLEDLVRARLVYELRSLWRLRLGDASGALLDYETTLKLAEHLATIPGLGSHAMRSAAVMGSFQTVWEGLKDRLWDDSQLAHLEGLIGEISLGQSYFAHLKQERAMALDVLERYATGRPVADEESMPIQRIRFFPEGWYYQNMVSLCEQMDAWFFRAGGVARDEPDAEPTLVAVKEMEEHFGKSLRLYRVHVDPLMLFFLRMAQFTLQQQSFVDMARVAIALERHRLAEGAYPPDLDALVPRFLEQLPNDRCSGESLIYRVKDNQTPLIYSVGLNQTDDGGVSGKAFEENDWVWQYDFPAFEAEDSP